MNLIRITTAERGESVCINIDHIMTIRDDPAHPAIRDDPRRPPGAEIQLVTGLYYSSKEPAGSVLAAIAILDGSSQVQSCE